MIELAPNRKQGLAIARAVMAAAGAVGFGGEAGDVVTLERFGALVTAPISLRPRRGSAPPRLAPLQGGMLLSSGEHNAGWRRVAEQHGGAWARSRVPVIAHIVGRTSLGELAITFRMSAVAVCRSSASRVSLNSRTFSMAITAWSAKVWSNWT